MQSLAVSKASKVSSAAALAEQPAAPSKEPSYAERPKEDSEPNELDVAAN